MRMSDTDSLIATCEGELTALNSKLTVAEKGRHDDVSKEEINKDQERVEFLKGEIKKLKSQPSP
jgi:hypothetical protein